MINILVLGGDMRHSYLAKSMNEFNVYTYAQEKGLEELAHTEYKFDKKIDIYIFPMPISLDGTYLNTTISDKKIKLSDILIDEGALVFGGSVGESVVDMFKQKNVEIIDYLKREELAVLNAIPTAEGAIGIALSEMPRTLHNSKVLVLGNGRIGKLLSNKLSALGAKTYVGARKPEDLSYINAYGLNPLNIGDIDYKKHNFDLIINTVPYCVLKEEQLFNISGETLVIDLASKPGGVDIEACKKLNIKVIWALSLPGKVAPITSAEFISQTVKNILYEMKVIL